jgi:hypothetical protein
MYSQVLVEFSVDSLPDKEKDGGDPLYACGNISVLVDDDLIQVGSFPGALLLLSTLENLATGVGRMRRGDKTIEVSMVGDSPALWIMERRVGGVHGISLAYREAETALVSGLDFDRACESASTDLLVLLHSSGVLEQPPSHIVSLLAHVTSVWPALGGVVASARPPRARR